MFTLKGQKEKHKNKVIMMQGAEIKNNGSKGWMKMTKRKWHKQ